MPPNANEPEAGSRTDEFQPLVQALARVHGSLSAVATVWRRLAPERPGLPLIRPLELAESVRDLMAR